MKTPAPALLPPRHQLAEHKGPEEATTPECTITTAQVAQEWPLGTIQGHPD